MQIIYIVYREDNSMVFNSQVLEYLKLLDKDYKVKLVVFRNYTNLFKKKIVEDKVSQYVNDFNTFFTFPLFSKIQLNLAAIRLKFIMKLKCEEKLLVFCRGELSTFIADKTFKKYKNKVILFDNRGLPIEELEMRKKNDIIYKFNKKVKLDAINYAKDNCDLYSFVTSNLRKYMLQKYDYNNTKKYFIIPTLNIKGNIDSDILKGIKKDINYDENNFYIIYIGSVAVWQSIDKLFDVFIKLKRVYNNSKLLILTNDSVVIPDKLENYINESIIIKSVNHNIVKYYLEISNLGLVIRNDNIVNKVAAPTKIAEYLSNNIPILYDGEIGVINDLIDKYGNQGLINLNKDDWEDTIKEIINNKNKSFINNLYDDYFDMEKNQDKLMFEIMKLLNK